MKRGEAGLILKRGPIEGAGNWTHMRGNIGRTASSGDERATLPLSMLWWGGPGPARIVSRHVYAPIPLVANGKIYIQGEHDLIAVNAYNGRELWNRQLRDIGRWPIFLRGGNIAADQECVYVVKDRTCQRIHGDSGQTLTTYSMPHLKRNDVENPEKATWEYLGVTKGFVIGSLGMGVNSGMGHGAGDRMPIESFAVCVFDKQSGNLLWSKVLDRFASHPAIVSDGEKLYLLDRTSERTYRGFIKSGSKDRGVSILRAFDLTDGKEVWQTSLNSGRNALMVQSNTVVALPKHGDVFPNTAGVSAYNATNGEQLWEQGDRRDKGKTGRFAYRRPSFIVDGLLYIPPRVYELKTGKEVYPFTSPISGEDQLFPMYQNFCGSVAASKHLLLYRNASVGMQEIKRNSGAFYLPEVRPGCEVNVIPAGGIVLAPEGSSTCTCSYSYKTSLALFSEDKQEDWALFLTDSKIEVDNPKPPAKKRRAPVHRSRPSPLKC